MNQKCEAKKWKEEFAKKKRRMSMLFHRSIKRRITNALEGRISLAHIVHFEDEDLKENGSNKGCSSKVVKL